MKGMIFAHCVCMGPLPVVRSRTACTMPAREVRLRVSIPRSLGTSSRNICVNQRRPL
jgi:hypothetical protein